MENMIKLLIGMIASGKSTYSACLANNGYIVVNDDSIVNLVHGGLYKLYSDKLKFLYKGIEDFIIKTSINNNLNIVIDRTCLKRSTRLRFVNYAKELNTKIDAILFPIELPEIHAKRRFESDPRGHTYEKWLKVAQEHIDMYEKPTLEEGFDNIICL